MKKNDDLNWKKQDAQFYGIFMAVLSFALGVLITVAYYNLTQFLCYAKLWLVAYRLTKNSMLNSAINHNCIRITVEKNKKAQANYVVELN